MYVTFVELSLLTTYQRTGTSQLQRELWVITYGFCREMHWSAYTVLLALFKGAARRQR